MTLVVEDGTGKSNAESYISVADATTYHSDRGNAAWAALATDAIREQHLRKATEYMTATYRQRWKGRRKVYTQALCWPRYDVYIEDWSPWGRLLPTDAVPPEVARACAELALRSITGDLLADLEPQVASETVGSISVSYVPGSPRLKQYPAVARLLEPFMSLGANAVKIQRG